MDIVIFSDSHGNEANMRDVIKRCDPDAVIFLGDGINDIISIEKSDPKRRIYTYVKGNCDLFSDEPTSKEFTFEGVRFLMLHGHTAYVKHGDEMLRSLALSKKVDIVLYGHTHTPNDTYIPESGAGGPFRLFNPGSIGSSYKPSFGTISVKNGAYLTNTLYYEKESIK